jgi:hypothetical protein
VVDTKGKVGTPKVDVLLDSRVSWAIRLRGGVRRGIVDLSRGSVRRFDLNAGAALLELRLPRLDGTLPIRMTGGLNTWQITTTGKVATRVLARQGAGRIILNGRDFAGVPRGRTVSSGSSGPDRIEVDAVGGIGKLTVAPD